MQRIVHENMETMLLEAECRSEHGFGYPKFIENAFRSFDRCGLLERGFSRLKCQGCGYERLVAFSCKSKICDSCHARRSMDLSLHLVSQVLPKVPYRQWTITFPRSIRFLLARDKKLLSKIFSCVIRPIFSWQRKQVKNEGFEEVYPGAVGLLQNFGGALNANFHAHNVLMDGVFVGNKEEQERQKDECTEYPVRVGSRIPWAELVRFSFLEDVKVCPKCGSAMLIIVVIGSVQTDVISKILDHLCLPIDLAEPHAARLPPQLGFAFDQDDAGPGTDGWLDDEAASSSRGPPLSL